MGKQVPGYGKKDKDDVRDPITQEKLYECQTCNQYKVKRKPGSPYVPKYCQACRLISKKKNLTKARAKRHESLDYSDAVMAKGPDGLPVYLRGEDEKKFFEVRCRAYEKEFDWSKSADKGLLSRLVALEINAQRVEKELYAKQTEEKLRVHGQILRNIQDIQEKLGITRKQRLESAKKQSPQDILNDLMIRFVKYREENKDKFSYMCTHCGKINVTYKENTSLKKDTKEPNPDEPIKKDYEKTMQDERSQESLTPLEENQKDIQGPAATNHKNEEAKPDIPAESKGDVEQCKAESEQKSGKVEQKEAKVEQKPEEVKHPEEKEDNANNGVITF